MSNMIEVNERTYVHTNKTCIVICIDGCEPDYMDMAMEAGLMPNLKAILAKGTSKIAHCVIPSFTNPNNLSIATGRAPNIHGICGNFLYDTQHDKEVMMNHPKFLRAPTIFKAFFDQGANIAIVTAKDKLRALLGHGLDCSSGRAMCFSAEKSNETNKQEHGIEHVNEWLGMPVPDVYSAELSEFVFAAGVKILQEGSPDMLYLTTTDYVQHKHAPGTHLANQFYAMFDGYLGQLDQFGATIVITADHGMKPKHLPDGSPNVLYLQDILDDWLGKAAVRVILPITDPYVVHHGALGSFATAYLPDGCDQDAMIAKLQALDGLEMVLSKQQACDQFELPEDRIGDVVLVSTENTVLGTSKDRHDLAALKEPLRSHGGTSEQKIPFIINQKIDLPEAPRLRNFDAYFYATRAADMSL